MKMRNNQRDFRHIWTKRRGGTGGGTGGEKPRGKSTNTDSTQYSSRAVHQTETLVGYPQL